MDTGFRRVYCWVWMSIIPTFKFSKDSVCRGGWGSVKRVIVYEDIVVNYKCGVMVRVENLEHSKWVMQRVRYIITSSTIDNACSPYPPPLTEGMCEEGAEDCDR